MDPSVEDNHTVNSAPQAMFVTSSDTTHGRGDDSTSTETNPGIYTIHTIKTVKRTQSRNRFRCFIPFLAVPKPNCPCLFNPKAKDRPSSLTTTVWLLPAPAFTILCLQQNKINQKKKINV